MSGEKQKVSPLTEPALPSFQFSIFNCFTDESCRGTFRDTNLNEFTDFSPVIRELSLIHI